MIEYVAAHTEDLKRDIVIVILNNLWQEFQQNNNVQDRTTSEFQQQNNVFTCLLSENQISRNTSPELAAASIQSLVKQGIIVHTPERRLYEFTPLDSLCRLRIDPACSAVDNTKLLDAYKNMARVTLEDAYRHITPILICTMELLIPHNGTSASDSDVVYMAQSVVRKLWIDFIQQRNATFLTADSDIGMITISQAQLLSILDAVGNLRADECLNLLTSYHFLKVEHKRSNAWRNSSPNPTTTIYEFEPLYTLSMLTRHGMEMLKRMHEENDQKERYFCISKHAEQLKCRASTDGVLYADERTQCDLKLGPSQWQRMDVDTKPFALAACSNLKVYLKKLISAHLNILIAQRAVDIANTNSTRLCLLSHITTADRVSSSFIKLT